MEKSEDKTQILLDLMKLHWGFNSFRYGQEKAIENVLAKKSGVVVMPTGGGKSLCFQLPALVLPGVTIVISPLIALMKDQVDSMQAIGVPATFVNSSLSLDETTRRLAAVKRGEYKLLYIAPERFYNQEFVSSLKDISVSLFAIDEAHCISQWGHDFRPSYLRLKDAIELVGSPPVLALTATATPEVREDIIKQLELKDPELMVTGFGRPNLQFGVIHASESHKPQTTLDAILSLPDGSGIIYVGTRKRVDALLEFLLAQDIEAVGYHAGMDPMDRKWVQEQFLSGQAKVIVATNAFGLGIDKENVRFVIHYDMPGTVEAYYQEAGRAGRDGKDSFCLMLYNSRDRALHEFFIKGDNPSPRLVRELYRLLIRNDDDSILVTQAELSEALSESAPEMAVGTALKILERENYISRAREQSGQAQLQLKKDLSSILDTLGERAKSQREIITKLHDRYGDELESGWQFKPEEIAEILDVKKESLMRLIRSLKDKGLAEYFPPFRGTEIRILKRVDPKELNFNEQEMKTKLKAAYTKLDKIEDYVYANSCRQQFILDYFGDLESRACGRCDACLSGNKILRPKKNQIRPNRRESAGFENVEPAPKNTLNTKLTQLETMELFNKGLSIEEIAATRDIKSGTVINHLCYLIEKGLIENNEKLIDKQTEAKVLRAVKKVGSDRLKPIYEELKGKIDYDRIKIALAFAARNQ